MSADGGGIPLEGGLATRFVVQRERERYEAMPEGLFAPAPAAPVASAAFSRDSLTYVAVDETDATYADAIGPARARYGFVPNLLRALSLKPRYFRRHLLAAGAAHGPRSPTPPG